MPILQTVFKLGYQISPVILTDGIAQAIPGGMLPIVTLTEGINLITGLISGGGSLNLDNFFAHWRPIPGATLVRQDVGNYPFANQAVAANATIQQPTNVSMLMACPAKGSGAFAKKLMTMQSMFAAINLHNTSGGSYTIATPSGFITGCLLRQVTDITEGSPGQPQSLWRWDFEKPLISAAQAQQTLSALMSKLDSGVSTPLSWSGKLPNVGTSISNAGSGFSSVLNGVSGSLTSAASGVSNTLGGKV